MPIFKCTDCGGDVNTEAKACPHCGATKPFKSQKLTVEQSKGMPYKDTKAFTKLGGDIEMSKTMKVVFGIIALFVFYVIVSPEKPLTTEELVEKQAKEEAANADDKLFELSTMCQLKIKRNLNDPDSADFGQYQILPIGENKYKIVYEVRAKNGFGGKVKGAFECVESYEDGKATVLSVKELH